MRPPLSRKQLGTFQIKHKLNRVLMGESKTKCLNSYSHKTDLCIRCCHCVFSTPRYIVNPDTNKGSIYNSPIHIFQVYFRSLITKCLQINMLPFTWIATVPSNSRFAWVTSGLPVRLKPRCGHKRNRSIV